MNHIRQIVDLARRIRDTLAYGFLRARRYLQALGWPFDLIASCLAQG